jgi:hypothetical protein
MDKNELFDVLLCSIFALYGSAARTLADNRAVGKSGWALTWLLVSNAVISGFCGLMAVPLSHVLKLDGPWRLFLAGMAGYMGLGFLAYLETMIKRRLDSHGSHRND